MKKILSIFLSLIIVLCLFENSAYATMNCKIGLTATKSTDLNVDDEIEVNINISNIESAKEGLVTFGATLEYPIGSLELMSMNGNGTYPKPSYSAKTGKLLIRREEIDKTEGTMFTIKFKVKNIETKNLIILLKDIEASDGTGLLELGNVSVTLKMKEESKEPEKPEEPSKPQEPTKPEEPSKPQEPTKPEEPSKPQEPTKPEEPGNTTEPDNTVLDNTTKPSQDGNQKPSNNNGSDTTKDEKLPQTGFNHKIIPCIILAVVIIAWGLYVKIKLIDRRIRKNEE